MKGWISLHRKIRGNWVWQDKPFSKGQAWIDILLLVNHEDSKIYFRDSVYDIKRGQHITSELKLAQAWGWSRNKVRKFLDDLKKEQMIELKKDKRKTTLTVVNYDGYQDNKTTKGTTDSTTDGTSESQQKDINNKDNNDNKENKENKEKIYVMTQQQEQFINILKTVSDYAVDLEKDIAMYSRLEERYPKLDLVDALKGWAMYKLDKPLNEKSNPRSQINTAFSKYTEWGKFEKEKSGVIDYEAAAKTKYGW